MGAQASSPAPDWPFLKNLDIPPAWQEGTLKVMAPLPSAIISQVRALIPSCRHRSNNEVAPALLIQVQSPTMVSRSGRSGEITNPPCPPLKKAIIYLT